MTHSSKQNQPSNRPEETTYNGWANRETWLVDLWLTNDQKIYDTIHHLVHNAEADYRAADCIKEFIEDHDPLDGTASVYTDLLNVALSRVDWLEIAQTFLEEK